MTTNQNRVEAGIKAKKDGHNFEEEVAELVGGRLPQDLNGNKTKVDVLGKDGLRLSIKNTGQSSSSTQIHVGSQEAVINYLKLSPSSETAFKLFLGNADPVQHLSYFKSVGGIENKLCKKTELKRHRCKASSIPQIHMDSLVAEFNKKNEDIFKLLFSHGSDGFEHIATHMVATVIKNDLQSSLVYSMEDLKDIFMKSTWVISSTKSTLHLKHEGVTICRFQVKGSSETNNKRIKKGLPPLPDNQLKAFRTSYHYAQFQVHKTLFKLCNSQPISSISSKKEK